MLVGITVPVHWVFDSSIGIFHCLLENKKKIPFPIVSVYKQLYNCFQFIFLKMVQGRRTHHHSPGRVRTDTATGNSASGPQDLPMLSWESMESFNWEIRQWVPEHTPLSQEGAGSFHYWEICQWVLGHTLLSQEGVDNSPH